MAQLKDTLVSGDLRVTGQIYGNAQSASTIEFIMGTQTASTGSWTGVTKDPVLYDGKIIEYYLPYAGSGNATLNLTLPDGTTTGAKNCYYNSTSRLTTHFGAYSQFALIYHKSLNIAGTNYEGWWLVDRGYDTNTVDRLRDTYFRPYAGSALYRYKFCALDKDNRVQPIVTTNQTDATIITKSPNTVGLRPYNIWFYNTTSTVSAGSVIGAYTLETEYSLSTCPYNFNSNVAAYRLVYLKGSYNSTTDLFTLDTGTAVTTGYWTEVPTNTANINYNTYFVEGKYYWLLGGTYSSADYITLFAYNPLYYFNGTELVPVANKFHNHTHTLSYTSTNTGTATATITTASHSHTFTGTGHTHSITMKTTTDNTGNAQPSFTGTTVNITFSGSSANTGAPNKDYTGSPSGITNVLSSVVLAAAYTTSTKNLALSLTTSTVSVASSAHTHSLSAHTHSVTAAGSISVATNASGNYQPSGTVASHSHTYYQPSQTGSTTATGTLSQVTVTGTASHSHTYDKANSPTGAAS